MKHGFPMKPRVPSVRGRIATFVTTRPAGSRTDRDSCPIQPAFDSPWPQAGKRRPYARRTSGSEGQGTERRRSRSRSFRQKTRPIGRTTSSPSSTATAKKSGKTEVFLRSVHHLGERWGHTSMAGTRPALLGYAPGHAGQLLSPRVLRRANRHGGFRPEMTFEFCPAPPRHPGRRRL